jgi:hypothetical protein
MTTSDLLKKLKACLEAREWAKDHPDIKDAWEKCPRGDWMLWVLAMSGYDHKRLVYTTCQCARLALPYAASPAVEECIQTTEAWTRGEATIEEVAQARKKCYAAAYAAAYAAVYAAYAAAYAAAYRAAAVADVAAYAAYTAAYAAADVAAYAAARYTCQRKQADIIQGLVSWEEVEGLIKKMEAA